MVFLAPNVRSPSCVSRCDIISYALAIKQAANVLNGFSMSCKDNWAKSVQMRRSPKRRINAPSELYTLRDASCLVPSLLKPLTRFPPSISLRRLNSLLFSTSRRSPAGWRDCLSQGLLYFWSPTGGDVHCVARCEDLRVNGRI